MAEHNRFEGVFAAILLLTFCTESHAAVLDSRNSCQNIGGSWTPVARPRQVGHCELAQSYTVQRGDQLFLSGAAPLTLVNNATLTVDGELWLSVLAKVEIEQGNLINNNYVELEDGSRINLWRGQIVNNGNFQNEGVLSNAYQADDGKGIFNNRKFDNFDGGIISNVGRFHNREGSEMINGPGGTINNHLVGEYLSNDDTHKGTFTNYKGGKLSVRGTFNLVDGGVMTNYSSIDIASANVTIGKTATWLNSRKGLVTNGDRGRVSIEGMFLNDNATIRNLQGGSISINKSGVAEFVDSLLYNAPPQPAGSIVSQGMLRFTCSKFDNQGSFSGLYIDYCKQGPLPFPKK